MVRPRLSPRAQPRFCLWQAAAHLLHFSCSASSFIGFRVSRTGNLAAGAELFESAADKIAFIPDRPLLIVAICRSPESPDEVAAHQVEVPPAKALILQSIRALRAGWKYVHCWRDGDCALLNAVFGGEKLHGWTCGENQRQFRSSFCGNNDKIPVQVGRWDAVVRHRRMHRSLTSGSAL
jgi:hypothetical protein